MSGAIGRKRYGTRPWGAYEDTSSPLGRIARLREAGTHTRLPLLIAIDGADGCGWRRVCVGQRRTHAPAWGPAPAWRTSRGKGHRSRIDLREPVTSGRAARGSAAGGPVRR
jgi:hypothetical protein